MYSSFQRAANLEIFSGEPVARQSGMPAKAAHTAASASTASWSAGRSSNAGSDASECTSNNGTDDDMNSGRENLFGQKTPPRRNTKGKGKGSPGSKGSPYRTSMAKQKVKDKSMKDCKVCKIKITDFDPAFEDGVTTVLWAARQKEG